MTPKLDLRGGVTQGDLDLIGLTPWGGDLDPIGLIPWGSDLDLDLLKREGELRV